MLITRCVRKLQGASQKPAELITRILDRLFVVVTGKIGILRELKISHLC